jgi:hypothetical protein
MQGTGRESERHDVDICPLRSTTTHNGGGMHLGKAAALVKLDSLVVRKTGG